MASVGLIDGRINRHFSPKPIAWITGEAYCECIERR